MQRTRVFAAIGLAICVAFAANSAAAKEGAARFRIDAPKVALTGVPFSLTVTALDPEGNTDTGFAAQVPMDGLSRQAGQGLLPVYSSGPFESGVVKLEGLVVESSGTTEIVVVGGEEPVSLGLFAIPGWLSVMPPLLAILLAFVLREVLLALLAGIWLGATLIHGANPLVGGMHALDTYLVDAMGDSDHAAIIMFSLTLGGMIGVISKGGGTEGIVARLSVWAQRPRGGQIATWAMGVFIFFDDYANTLIVGNTMRPLTDRLRISREKLSFIVDATAAPVASIAFISSWVGFQVGLIAQAFESISVERDAL